VCGFILVVAGQWRYFNCARLMVLFLLWQGSSFFLVVAGKGVFFCCGRAGGFFLLGH
jgi:hypothetical protein